MSDKSKGYLMAGLATLAWSTTGIFIDQLVTAYGLTALQISLWRGLIIVPALALYIGLTNPAHFRLDRRDIGYLAIYGLIGIGIFNLAWNLSVEFNKAAVAVALIYSSPVFVAVGARLIFREALGTVQVTAIGLNLLGCGLVAGINDPARLIQSPLGLLYGLGSGLTFAAATLFGKGLARRGRQSSLTILFYIFLFGTLPQIPLSLLLEGTAGFTPRLDMGGWGLLVGLSLGPTLAGYAFFTVSLNYLPAAVIGLVTTLEPPITAVLALMLLGRQMNGLQWLGTACIVSGVAVIQVANFSFRQSGRKSLEPAD